MTASHHQFLTDKEMGDLLDREARIAASEDISGPDASARDTKNGARAGAGRREDVAMQTIQQNEPLNQREARIMRVSDPVESARRLLDSLRARFEREGPFAEFIEVTPALARLILDRNSNNRSLKAQQVETIARDICDGRWQSNGETIVLSTSGELNDGQHRLTACVAADLPIVTLVAYGTARETRQTIDSNQTTRTPGDFLAMAGIEDGNNIAATAAYLWQIRRYGEIPKHFGHPSKRPTKQQIQEFVGAHLRSVSLATRVTSSSKAGRLSSKSLIAVALHHIRDAIGAHAEGDEPEIFIKALLTGDNLRADDPVMVVRNRLIDDKRRHRADPRVAMELIVRAWNLRCRRQTIAKCISTGELPAVETHIRLR